MSGLPCVGVLSLPLIRMDPVDEVGEWLDELAATRFPGGLPARPQMLGGYGAALQDLGKFEFKGFSAVLVCVEQRVHEPLAPENIEQ